MHPRLRLFVLSFLMLFTELALIRWTGSNVLYLSFFSNFVLLGSFLGIGLGFLWSGRGRALYPYAPVALLALVAFIRFVPVNVERGGSELIFFGGLDTSGPPREVMLPFIFLAVAAAMMFIADGVARVFAQFPPLTAYKLDLGGSIAGIVAFSALSFLHAPPVVWGVVVGIVFLATAESRMRWLQLAPILLLIVVLLAESLGANTWWSPYYKVEADRAADGNTTVYVNGVFHQFHQRNTAAPSRAVYDVARPRALDDVLVIGAGGGNDTSVALKHGAKHVDAVEIDPVIYELGKTRHPDRPYSDPRVDAHIDDGRAFLERSKKKYDLILFALPDSITLVSGQSSLRLESFLFTKEAMESARDHLKPGGVFSMYNYYREPWLADRLANTLDEVYGRAPCADRRDFFGASLSFFTASESGASIQCSGQFAEEWKASTSFPAPATDDHPFPYLRGHTIPTFYLVSIALVLLVSLLAVRLVGGPMRPMLRYLDLFFMGAAFLLLETKNVVQFALLFGTTWFVNALVFLGVLVAVFGAVLVAERVSIKYMKSLYGLLFVSILVAALVPPASLLELDVVPRFLVATTLAFFPIFTANLVFAERFKTTSDSTTAFGANLLGAMVGGVIEYLALVTGYRALLLLAAVLYALAYVFGRTHLRSAPAAPGAVAAPVGG